MSRSTSMSNKAAPLSWYAVSIAEIVSQICDHTDDDNDHSTVLQDARQQYEADYVNANSGPEKQKAKDLLDEIDAEYVFANQLTIELHQEADRCQHNEGILKRAHSLDPNDRRYYFTKESAYRWAIQNYQKVIPKWAPSLDHQTSTKNLSVKAKNLQVTLYLFASALAGLIDKIAHQGNLEMIEDRLSRNKDKLADPDIFIKYLASLKNISEQIFPTITSNQPLHLFEEEEATGLVLFILAYCFSHLAEHARNEDWIKLRDSDGEITRYKLTRSDNFYVSSQLLIQAKQYTNEFGARGVQQDNTIEKSLNEVRKKYLQQPIFTVDEGIIRQAITDSIGQFQALEI